MTFTHLDETTPEDAWAEAGVAESPRFAPDTLPGGPVVVLLAHPDDEALGCPGLLTRLGAEGRDVDVLLCTAGENSHPQSPTHTPERAGDPPCRVRLRPHRAGEGRSRRGSSTSATVGFRPGMRRSSPRWTPPSPPCPPR